VIKQRTIKNIIRATGVGLHTGEKVYLTLRPAAPNTGVVFRRVDLPQPVDIKAVRTMSGTRGYRRALERDGVRVSTVEHLMSALAGLASITCYVDLSAGEVPIMDGSAGPFVFLLQSAGVEEQPVGEEIHPHIETGRGDDGDKSARFDPHQWLQDRVSASTSIIRWFDNSAKSVCVDFATTSRTSGKSAVRAPSDSCTKSNGCAVRDLALGGSLDNAIVLDEYRVLNSDGLRYHDEFVKHKVLDAIGDLYLLGHPVIGAFSAHKSGHALTTCCCGACWKARVRGNT